MEIVVVKAPQSADARGLEDAAKKLGLRTRSLALDNCGTPQVGEQTQGLVVLDDGAPGVGAWVREATLTVRYLSLPVVAVTDRPLEMLEAGASAVCNRGELPEQILLLLQNQRDVQPVVSDLRDHLLAPFIKATEQTFQEMAETQVKVRTVYRKSGYRMFGDLSSVIGLLGESEGSMVISFPNAVAMQVARMLLRSVPGEPGEELMRDCIGELANVIAGQARSMVEKSRFPFSISTPTVIAGAGHEIRHKPGSPCLVVAFQSDHGEFAMQICSNLRDGQHKGSLA